MENLIINPSYFSVSIQWVAFQKKMSKNRLEKIARSKLNEFRGVRAVLRQDLQIFPM